MIIYGAKKAWFSQRDNSWNPNSTCFATSMASAMAVCLAYYDLPVPKDLDEQLISDIVGRMPRWKQWLYRVNPKALARPDQVYAFWPAYFEAAQDKWPGFSAKYYGDGGLSFPQVDKLIDSLLPCVVGTYFTHKGHLICLAGRDKKGYIALDPFGNANADYGDKNGKLNTYRYDDPRWGGSKLLCVTVDYTPPKNIDESEDTEDDDDEE